MTPAPVIRLAGLTHRYGKVLAADGVDLELPAGCMVGFIGPDGVGKSTWLGLIAGARKIQQGTVEVLGGDMASQRHREAVCPRIAYMPQGLGKNLYPTLSVFENIDFFGRLFGQPKAERERRIAELLEATGLAGFADRPAQKLSGGMKQKLGLCCALIHDPDLLILDEPTTGVDPLSRRQFWDLIGSIRTDHPGMSVLVATAYMEEAEQYDWLVAVDSGRVLATGAPAELRTRTGAATLEEAFLALLPEDRRGGHTGLTIPPLAAGEVVIEARGLQMRFGDFIAVDDVNLQVRRGEIFGFLGSNGCGKSTTMKMLTGLLPPTQGEARLLGEVLDADNIEIPPLLIQPYVENAIWHGLLHRESGGHLSVRIRQEQETLICDITDNGIGREKAMEYKSASAPTRQSVGMKLTQERLQITGNAQTAHGAQQIIDLYDEHGAAGGTKIVLTIPV